MIQTAPYIVQWSEGGPAGSQLVTLAMSFVGTPSNDALLLRIDLLSPISITGRKISCATAPTLDQEFIIAVDDVQVAHGTILAGLLTGPFVLDETLWPAGALTVTGPVLISDPIADISITVQGAQA